MPIEQLKENLEYLRTSKKMNLIDFSHLMGYKDKMYTVIKYNDTMPNTDSLIAVSKHFKVSIDFLVRHDLSKITKEKIQSNYRYTKRLCTLKK